MTKLDLPPIRRCDLCSLVSRAHRCPRCGRQLSKVEVTGLGPREVAALLADLVRVEWSEHGRLLLVLLRWGVIGAVVGVLAGTSSAVFLFGLQVVTEARLDQPALLFGLPVGGLLVGLVYHHLGGRAAGGSNLVIDEAHVVEEGTPRAGSGPLAEADEPPSTGPRRIPTRLAPLVLLGTWMTHLFGGSAGREGTAIQMSAALSDRFSHVLRLTEADRRLVLVAAISGGFASVFGVPMAGTVFGLEVRAVGRVRFDALVPALAASLVGTLTVDRLGLPHDVTPSFALPAFELRPGLLGSVLVAGVAFAAASSLFSELTDGIRRAFRVLVPYPPLRPFFGGVLVIGLALAVRTDDYLGLSLPLIGDALEGTGVVWYAFALKLLFTAVTLGAGFQGGEVTPLFVVGATLGAALAGPLGVPPELLASIGFVAVFAAATNTPIACTIMGVELFGVGAFPYLMLGCVVAYVLSGHRGIYGTQRIGSAKHPAGAVDLNGRTLRDLDAGRRSWLQRRR